MFKEDSLQFAQERLRQHHVPSPLTRELGFKQKPQVKRRLVAEMPKGEARTFDRVNESVLICCSSGSLWITHDGDPKDVILSAGESYRAEREDAMHVFAMQDCVLEIEFEDVVLEH
jgi:hypothetical protein